MKTRIELEAEQARNSIPISLSGQLTIESSSEEMQDDLVKLTLGTNGPYIFNANDIMRALKACSLQF